MSKTKFEPTPEGLFYTPNAHLGIALSMLFVARIIYRIVEVYAIGLVRWRFRVLRAKRLREEPAQKG